MTDEARLARLTELARRVWPDDREIAVEHYEKREVIVWGHDGESHARIDHPRAFDALEAALLVLSGDLVLTGDERSLMRPDVQRIVQANVDVGMAYTELLLQVEQLAAEWEAQAASWRNNHEHDDGVEECEEACNAEAKQVERCARMLRERAKRGEP